ncbi:MAG: porphobilinogen synthase [Nitrososphaerales archaeon]
MSFPSLRLRRLRRKESLRKLFEEVKLHPSNLIYPLFVDERIEEKEEIVSMPGQFRLSLKSLVKEVNDCKKLGINSFLFFGIPKLKDEHGSEAYNPKGIIQRAIEVLRKEFGEDINIITDVCLCEYTSHGHCGLIKDGYLDNDSSLELLKKIAITHAQAGADMVAPSAMLDGQVKALREALDDNNFHDTLIMGYSAKHASCFYSPFRDAALSAPKFGDRKSYQMSYKNKREALREIELDIREGADVIMVKPALAYLDIIHLTKNKFNLPLAAFNVSGEYSMIKAASKLGWLDEKEAIIEILTSIKRAGADMIITYFAKDLAEMVLKDEL